MEVTQVAPGVQARPEPRGARGPGCLALLQVRHGSSRDGSNRAKMRDPDVEAPAGWRSACPACTRPRVRSPAPPGPPPQSPHPSHRENEGTQARVPSSCVRQGVHCGQESVSFPRGGAAWHSGDAQEDRSPGGTDGSGAGPPARSGCAGQLAVPPPPQGQECNLGLPWEQSTSSKCACEHWCVHEGAQLSVPACECARLHVCVFLGVLHWGTATAGPPAQADRPPKV